QPVLSAVRVGPALSKLLRGGCGRQWLRARGAVLAVAREGVLSGVGRLRGGRRCIRLEVSGRMAGRRPGASEPAAESAGGRGALKARTGLAAYARERHPA